MPAMCDECGAYAARVAVSGITTAAGRLVVSLDPPEGRCLRCYRQLLQQARLDGLRLERSALRDADTGVVALAEVHTA